MGEQRNEHYRNVAFELKAMMPKTGVVVDTIPATFVLDPDDGQMTCIWKALKAVSKDDWVTSHAIVEALKDCSFSEATLRSAMCRMWGIIEKRRFVNHASRTKFWAYRLVEGGKTPTDKKKGKTAKERNPIV